MACSVFEPPAMQASSNHAAHGEDAIFRAGCTMPECGSAFSFKGDDARAFELPLAWFERRYFYRSELLTSS